MQHVFTEATLINVIILKVTKKKLHQMDSAETFSPHLNKILIFHNNLIFNFFQTKT